nr:TMV resistance protein N [Malus domestica]
MGGIGKTTLAKLVCDRIFHHFEVHCFLGNVREVSNVDLQKRLLFPVLREKIEEIWDEERRIIFTKKFLRNKKVLRVLDDVDHINQLQVLAGKEDWFGMGSRIIITTRNERLLVQHDVTLCHHVKMLDKGAALELFSLHAFKKNMPEDGFWELSTYFINYAGGLPLALETLGSALFKRRLDTWNSVWDNLSKIPNPTIFDKLKISYDGLEEWEKRIFLDVACFHKGKYTKRVIEMLDDSFGISSSIMIDVLIERSLIYQDHRKCIWMHDLIPEMAWIVIAHESKEPSQRSSLWLYNDIYHVFRTNTGTRTFEAISLRQLKVEENLVETHPSIAVLKRLKDLNLRNCESINTLPSKVEMDYLEYFCLYGCSNVKNIPEFGEQMKNVSWISLSGTAIEKIPSSIGHLVGLRELHVRNCKNLLNLPRAICNLKSLEGLYVNQCSKIDKLTGDMDRLEALRWGPTMTQPLVSMKNLKSLVFKTNSDIATCGSDGKARDGWGLRRLFGLQKSHPDPPPCWGLVLSSLNRLCNLRRLELKNCPSNFYGGSVTCQNCIALVQDEDLSNRILKSVIQGLEIVIPGSEIPKWFNNQSVRHSINVELPPLSCTNWLGIALCAVSLDPNPIQNVELPYCFSFRIHRSGKLVSPEILGPEYNWNTLPSLVSENLSEQFLFGVIFGNVYGRDLKAGLDKVKKCGARLVYKQDLKELNQKHGARLVYEQDLKELNKKLLKRTHEIRDEVAPSGPGSASFNHTEHIRKRRCN